MKHKKFNEVLPYTYYIVEKETRLQYFGVRTANVRAGRTPEEDFAKHYFSSGAFMKSFKQDPSKYDWRLCNTFDTTQEAIDYEEKILRKVYLRPSWANNSVSKIINYTDEILEKMRLRGEQIVTEDGLTLNKLRGQLSRQTRLRRGTAKIGALKGSEVMRNTILETGETMHEYRIRKGLETKRTPREDGLTPCEAAGKKISAYLNTVVTEDGLTVAQVRHRTMVANFASLPEWEFEKRIGDKHPQWQTFIRNAVAKYKQGK